MNLIENKILDWVIIGPGNIARDFIEDMKYVTECRNRVVAVMSNDLKEAKEFSIEHHIPHYFSSIARMLKTVPADIAYISTPHASHYEQALECLEHRIPVLCEKPLALNVEQAARLLQASAELNTFLMAGMWIRFLPSIKQVLELLEQNIIGRINSIVADMSYRAPKDAANRFYNPDLGGGSLLDLGIYPVYLSLLILGVPRDMKTTAILSRDNIDKSCAVIFEYDSGAYAILESSIIKETEKQARIYGEKGYITILPPWNEKSAGIVLNLYDGTSVRYPCEWEGRGFQFEIAEAVHCLASRRIQSALHSHEESIKLISLLDDIRHRTHVEYPLYE
jgi:predicted dehydrogenase